MNNKGFTLIEIIVVIALIALFAVLISTNLNGLKENQDIKNYENYKYKLQTAACEYVEKFEMSQQKKEIKEKCHQDTGYSFIKECYIDINDLISNGLVSADMVNVYKDITVYDDAKVSGVLVYYQDGEKKCEYREDIKEG